MSVDVGHDRRVVRLQCVIQFLLDLVCNGIELVDEVQAVVEVQIPALLTPWARFERLHVCCATSSLLEVQEFWVTFMNLDEVSVLIHQLDDGLVLFFVLHVECLYGNLGKT